ncbi:hypothetical protein RD110_24220 [Rhodoferax koreense]|uniref:Thiamine biosynthesis protein ApbE n=1 Tax=Rhodoferax koreensis TaxID=1842727 RepID=A0A1P8K1R0_9BURK|nr:UPF0280 family protein [Rhodoferax koreense]APW39926.1 hypothetical protein RD110_24220 [Rhodoferax koreense]
MKAQRARLPDGRWHFQNGPMDIVIGAEGESLAVQLAHEAAWQRFYTLLPELVAELRALRLPLPPTGPLPPAGARLDGRVARRMWAACAPYRAEFITPMAAVAGAVAQELIACYHRPGVGRAWVNNGGDIAVYLTPGQSVRIGLFADLARWGPAMAEAAETPQGLRTDAQCELAYESPARGVATSGWRGRSFSLGIADSVTILAATAAEADAAATVVANAVDVPHPGIERRPANTLKDDTDLGDIPVTVQVPPLPEALVREALAAGLARAEALQQAGLLWSATLVCQGQWAQTRSPGMPPSADTRPGPPQLGSVFA